MINLTWGDAKAIFQAASSESVEICDGLAHAFGNIQEYGDQDRLDGRPLQCLIESLPVILGLPPTTEVKGNAAIERLFSSPEATNSLLRECISQQGHCVGICKQEGEVPDGLVPARMLSWSTRRQVEMPFSSCWVVSPGFPVPVRCVVIKGLVHGLAMRSMDMRPSVIARTLPEMRTKLAPLATPWLHPALTAGDILSMAGADGMIGAALLTNRGAQPQQGWIEAARVVGLRPRLGWTGVLTQFFGRVANEFQPEFPGAFAWLTGDFESAFVH
jgi:hypothetical protein